MKFCPLGALFVHCCSWGLRLYLTLLHCKPAEQKALRYLTLNGS